MWEREGVQVRACGSEGGGGCAREGVQENVCVSRGEGGCEERWMQVKGVPPICHSRSSFHHWHHTEHS